jgi:hypothetical protein
MHYIIGTQIIFKKVPPRIGTSSRDFSVSKPPPGFEHNTIYTLYHIQKSGDTVIYKFSGGSSNDNDLEFNSIRDGDVYISKLRNEELPNYASIYSRNTG